MLYFLNTTKDAERVRTCVYCISVALTRCRAFRRSICFIPSNLSHERGADVGESRAGFPRPHHQTKRMKQLSRAIQFLGTILSLHLPSGPSDSLLGPDHALNKPRLVPLPMLPKASCLGLGMPLRAATVWRNGWLETDTVWRWRLSSLL